MLWPAGRSRLFLRRRLLGGWPDVEAAQSGVSFVYSLQPGMKHVHVGAAAVMPAKPLELSLLYLRLTGASRSESLLITCSVIASSSLSEGSAAPGLHWEHAIKKQEHTGAIA